VRRCAPRFGAPTDQIVLKAKPDLADAFLLHVREVATHPDWAVTGS
jgi:hypothetical protein